MVWVVCLGVWSASAPLSSRVKCESNVLEDNDRVQGFWCLFWGEGYRVLGLSVPPSSRVQREGNVREDSVMVWKFWCMVRVLGFWG